MLGLVSLAGSFVAGGPPIRKYAFGLGIVAMFASLLLGAATSALAPNARMITIADPLLLDYPEAKAAGGE